MMKILNIVWFLVEIFLMLFIYGGTILSVRNMFYPVVEYEPYFMIYIIPFVLLFVSIFVTYTYFNLMYIRFRVNKGD